MCPVPDSATFRVFPKVALAHPRGPGEEEALRGEWPEV